MWWMRGGIQHQRILPGQPQQNGAHERMHKTLKAEAIRPPRATVVAQQRAFNRFRREYNEERPHEYLRGTTPASRYRPRRVHTVSFPVKQTLRNGLTDCLVFEWLDMQKGEPYCSRYRIHERCSMLRRPIGVVA